MKLKSLIVAGCHSTSFVMSGVVTPVSAALHRALICALLVLPFVAMPTTTLAVTLYDNGGPNRIDASEMTYWIVADDFTLTTPARIETVTFWNIEASGAFDGSILWWIYSNSPDSGPAALVASGTAGNLNRALTTFATEGYPESVNTFTLSPGPVSLPAGTYWLALHNGDLTNNTRRRFYWSMTDSNSTLPSLSLATPFTGRWYTISFPGWPNSTELAFNLGGTPAPVITSVTTLNKVPRIAFTTLAGRTYRVDFKNALTDSVWTTVAGAEMVSGTDGTVSIKDSDPNIHGHRFYRVVLL